MQVREKDPTMYVVPFVLGETALGEQEWDEADVELRKCLELNPHFDQAMLGLARSLIFRGKSEEAKQWTRSALKYNPENYRAWYQLGSIEARTDKQAAIADYEKAVSIQGNFPPLRKDLGLLLFHEGNYSEAAKQLSRAIALGINDAVVYNDLGISYSRMGHVRKGIDSYQQALKLDPDLAQAHLNLGYAYEQLNQKNLARREYQRACQLKTDLCQMIRQHSASER